jgi:signal transduction histidine kinase
MSRDRFTRLDPAALIGEIAELYAPVLEDAGIDFAVQAVPAPAVAVHRELLSQAIANLLDNAIKHGSGGQIVLRLATEPGAIRIEVADKGRGIALADQATAVRRFGRLDAARSEPGAGLGLALVEAVARLHRGRLELGDNAPGLVARIVLPV